MLQNALMFLIHLPDRLLDLCLIHHTYKRFQEYVETPFVCPNCGKTFYAKWYHLYFGRNVTLEMVKKVKLKCPHCKERDMCRWMKD